MSRVIAIYVCPTPIFSVVSAPKGVDYDVIFSLTAGLEKVYPNFSDKPHSLVYKNEEKLRVHLMHTGTPSASGLTNRQ